MSQLIEELESIKKNLLYEGYSLDDKCVKVIDKHMMSNKEKTHFLLLIEIVEKSNLSTATIASKMQISQGALSQIVNNKSNFTAYYDKLFMNFQKDFWNEYEILAYQLSKAVPEKRLMYHKKIAELLRKTPTKKTID